MKNYIYETFARKKEGKEAVKMVFIRARRGRTQTQARDLKIIMVQAHEIMTSDNHDDVLIQTSIAVGYANAMFIHGLIGAEELVDLVDMLGKMGENKIKEVDKMKFRAIIRHLGKKVVK